MINGTQYSNTKLNNSENVIHMIFIKFIRKIFYYFELLTITLFAPRVILAVPFFASFWNSQPSLLKDILHNPKTYFRCYFFHSFLFLLFSSLLFWFRLNSYFFLLTYCVVFLNQKSLFFQMILMNKFSSKTNQDHTAKKWTLKVQKTSFWPLFIFIFS